MSLLNKIDGLSKEDKAYIQSIESMIGPDPKEIGFTKGIFSGKFNADYIFPYPEQSQQEYDECTLLLSKLTDYLKNEHPSIQIDKEEKIPKWVLKRLFKIGAMGITIPKEYGGLGLGVTSYNKALEQIGAHCGSTAVVASAHQSIGCKAIMLFGTEKQKKTWLPALATNTLSAFCLSEPNVGSDAGGQETHYTLSENGNHYIINGEKKWATSGALSGLFTVIAKENTEKKPKISAFICTPDMKGIDIFQKNRSKCGIRGTWQARIKFTNVKVPKENLLSKEGKGLTIALSCLNYGRCTLSAGMLGAAKKSMGQSIKWVQNRDQFKKPLATFELVKEHVARMSALTYGMEAMLYMVTGMLDRQDKDIMVETAICKVFNSEMGWKVINDAIQIMGGEAYMTENEVERIMRDNRIHLIVEGSNQVMQPFIFAYGGKPLLEYMLNIKNSLLFNKNESILKNINRITKNILKPALMLQGLKLGTELFLGIKPPKPAISSPHPSLTTHINTLKTCIQHHSHHFKKTCMKYEEKMIHRQIQQSRLADSAIWIFAMSCTLSKRALELKKESQQKKYEKNKARVDHFINLASQKIHQKLTEIHINSDITLEKCAQSTYTFFNSLPDNQYIMPEKSTKKGKSTDQTHIKQFK